MTRPLGSFNQRINLPNHPEDYQRRQDPRVAALRPELTPLGKVRASDLGMKNKHRGTHGKPGANRMAGQILNIDLSPGTVSKDPGGYAESVSGTNEPVLTYGGRITQPVYADLGFKQIFSYQPLQGYAEQRTQ